MLVAFEDDHFSILAEPLLMLGRGNCFRDQVLDCRLPGTAAVRTR